MTDLPAAAYTAASLLPGEALALKMARAQLERGENPPFNMTGTLVAALERIIAAAPHLTAAATAAEREKIRAAIADEYGPSEARKMRRVLLGDAS